MLSAEERRDKGIPTLGISDQTSSTSSPRFRRRKYLIDRRRQLLATARVAGVVLVLLVLVNLVFSLWGAMETQTIIASNPQLTEEMQAVDRRSELMLGAVSLLVLMIVIVRSIVLTHRTAGAAFNLRRCLDRVASGDYDTMLRMRRKDNLRHLEDPFNRMTESLRDRAAEDHGALSSLAAKIEELGHAELAEEVRKLAEAKTQLADPPS